MKINNAVILILIVLLLTLIGGCKNAPNEEVVQFPENTKQEVNLKYGDITNPVELEKLWQEYFYDSIATIGNSREFNSAMEIDPVYVAKFCGLKYIGEHGQESLELVSENSNRRLFPLNTVLEYAERYFNITSLDVTEIDDEYYDTKKRAFMLNFGGKRDRPTHNDSNSWGIHLDKAVRNSDGTVTAVLVRHDSSQTDRIELTKTYTLKQREDGSLYFVNGRWDYVNNHLVVLTGNYQRFDQITGFAGNMEELSMLGEVDGRLIMAYTPYEKGKNPALMLVNPNTMTVEKTLEVNEKTEFTDVSLIGESIIIRLNDRFIVVDKTLARKDSIFLPKTIAKKINREPCYNEKGTPDVFFGGYDVSGDRKRFVYSDETGVKLFNTIDNSEKLLSKTVPITNSELLDNSYHKDPRFVDDERKVITTMTGYEGAYGYTLCDLKSETEKTHGITGEWSSTGLIRYDTGMLEINTHLYNQETQIGECKSMYLDFRTGNVREIRLNDPGETGDIRSPDLCYVGQNYAAFITYKRDDRDNSGNMFYLNRLDLKTLTVDPGIISVKAAGTHILGVLADGRIVFWYSLNPSEEGICITK